MVISDDELAALDPEAQRTIDIDEFVDLADIDPIFFDAPYYLAPDQATVKAYALLARTMEQAGKVGIARFVMRTKQYLAAIRPVDGHLVLSTMVYADEVNDPDEIPELDDVAEVERLRQGAGHGPSSSSSRWPALRAREVPRHLPRAGPGADRGARRRATRGRHRPPRPAGRGGRPDGRARGLGRGAKEARASTDGRREAERGRRDPTTGSAGAAPTAKKAAKAAPEGAAAEGAARKSA